MDGGRGRYKVRDHEDDPATGPAARQVRLLKALMVGGILVLMAGLAFVLTTLVARMRTLPQGPAVSTVLAWPASIDVALPAGATVRDFSQNGSHLTVHFAGPTGEGFLIVDLTTGRTATRVDVQPARPK